MNHNMKNSQLVYSTLTHLNQKCPQCKLLASECICTQDVEVNVKEITAKLRMEKSGRGGKTVTVIDNLPKSDKFLKELATELKKKCGTGGTHFISETSGVIEIQGDKREVIRPFLLKKEIKVNG